MAQRSMQTTPPIDTEWLQFPSWSGIEMTVRCSGFSFEAGSDNIIQLFSTLDVSFDYSPRAF